MTPSGPDETGPESAETPTALEFTRPVSPRDLPKNANWHFRESASPEERAALAKLFNATAVHQMRIAGEITPFRGNGFRVRATVTAKVEQECVVSLMPVLTKVNQEITRAYLPDFVPNFDLESDDIFAESEDDDIDDLNEGIDLGLLATEIVALSLPMFPRAKQAQMAVTTASPDGAEPISDEETKPFAQLAALRDKLSKKDSEN